jgi:hypothetical protein
LFLLDKGNFAYEYVERIERGGIFIDLDHVPRQWIQGLIPVEVDQKMHEMQILYDRDWSLTNTKLLMAKSYGSPERVGIRTEAHIIDSDIYLSRATSAHSREDYRSAYLFSTVALESILKVLMDIALEPFSNSHAVERLESSAAKLGMQRLFVEYLNIARLNEVDSFRVKEKLKFFRVIWDETNFTARRNPSKLESSHFNVRTKLNYLLNPAFLQGLLARANDLIDSGKMAEASHYLDNVLLDIIENYVWLKSSIKKVKTDHTTIMRSLESLEDKTPKNYEQIIDFFDLSNIEKLDAASAIERTREIILKVRRDRKVLIKNHLIKS